MYALYTIARRTASFIYNINTLQPLKKITLLKFTRLAVQSITIIIAQIFSRCAAKQFVRFRIILIKKSR